MSSCVYTHTQYHCDACGKIEIVSAPAYGRPDGWDSFVPESLQVSNAARMSWMHGPLDFCVSCKKIPAGGASLLATVYFREPS